MEGPTLCNGCFFGCPRPPCICEIGKNYYLCNCYRIGINNANNRPGIAPRFLGGFSVNFSVTRQKHANFEKRKTPTV